VAQFFLTHSVYSKDNSDVRVYVRVLVSLRRSVLFPLISLLILLVGEIIAIFSYYDRRKKVLTFVSGILFVIAGTCIAPSVSISLCLSA